MTGITTAVTVLSCSLFVAGIIKMLAPSGSSEKILRLVISLFVLLCVVVCFKSIADNVSIEDAAKALEGKASESIDSSVDKNVLKLTGDYLVQYAQSLLQSESISAENIEITVKPDENSVIYISDISIYIDKSKALYESKITELMENEFKVTPKIIVEE